MLLLIPLISEILACLIAIRLQLPASAVPAPFRVLPYVQNPSQNEITIRWLTEESATGTLLITIDGEKCEFNSDPQQPSALAYNIFGEEPADRCKTIPFLHSVRVTGLQPGTNYPYVVRQPVANSSEGAIEVNGTFQTAPGPDQAIRFIVYSDSETEPESTTSPPVDWPALAESGRPDHVKRYLVNQTIGYQQNLKIIGERSPNFICIAGDLVESGGEQRDWDEFWRHVAGEFGSIASQRPIFPAIGNHENYGGPGAFGGYSAEAADFGVKKLLTYFDVPHNQASNPQHVGRYYRIDYGPMTLITLDSSDGLPHQTRSDTNHNLSGSNAPDFNPGSEQYQWLEAQLADAQHSSRFTFVQFHHTPYGSGPHSVPFGTEGFSGQSGIAMRVLRPLLMQYGVDVVFCGHDELLERSLVPGVESLPNGSERAHEIHFYDVGIGGDGMRGPSANTDNPFRKFLAHNDSVEVWDGQRLVSGGKHYGHVEVNVSPNDAGHWTVRIEPVHAFPLTEVDGQVTSWERRCYDDVVTITQPTN